MQDLTTHRPVVEAAGEDHGDASLAVGHSQAREERVQGRAESPLDARSQRVGGDLDPALRQLDLTPGSDDVSHPWSQSISMLQDLNWKLRSSLEGLDERVPGKSMDRDHHRGVERGRQMLEELSEGLDTSRRGPDGDHGVFIGRSVPHDEHRSMLVSKGRWDSWFGRFDGDGARRYRFLLMKFMFSSLVFGAGLLFVSCAGSQNPGLSDGTLSGDPEAMWKDGQKLTVQGESIVSAGEKLLAQGRKQISDGEAKVKRGSDLVSSIRVEYQTAARKGGTATTPKAVDDEAKALKAIGSRWEKAIKMIRDGNKAIDRGNEVVDEGHAEVRKGRGLVERGSILMRNSERLRLGQELVSPSTP